MTDQPRPVKASGAPRQAMPEQPAADRVHNFDEVPHGLSPDQAMVEAARWLWFECGLAAELSGAAAVAALMTGAVPVRPGSTVCALVCGAGTDGLG